MKTLILLLFISFSFVACSQKSSSSFQNVDNQKFAELMKESNIVIIDVRTPEEYKEGHIPHSMLINFYDKNFSQNLDTLNKSKTYLVYCAAGGRSSKASTQLSGKGFKNVYNLEHGFSQWDGDVAK